MKRKNSGFTLIELLVVISIIALLSSVVLSSVSVARAKARDTKKIQSMSQLRNAVELYASDNSGKYPLTADQNIQYRYTSKGKVPISSTDKCGNETDWPSEFKIAMGKYISELPKDDSSDPDSCYVYSSNESGTGGLVWATFEAGPNSTVRNSAIQNSPQYEYVVAGYQIGTISDYSAIVPSSALFQIVTNTNSGGTGNNNAGQTVTVDAPTGAVAVAMNGGGIPQADNADHIYRIYSYKVVNGQTYYSTSYTQATQPGFSAGGPYRVEVAWVGALGVDGYRVRISDSYLGYTFDTKYEDVTVTNYTDNGDGSGGGSGGSGGGGGTPVASCKPTESCNYNDQQNCDDTSGLCSWTPTTSCNGTYDSDETVSCSATSETSCGNENENCSWDTTNEESPFCSGSYTATVTNNCGGDDENSCTSQNESCTWDVGGSCNVAVDCSIYEDPDTCGEVTYCSWQ